MKRFFRWLVLSLALGLVPASAEDWVRGSAVVLEASGGVEVQVPAEGKTLRTFDGPRYLSGIFSCHAGADGSALFYTSNGMTINFRGEGQFAVERFEGIFNPSEDQGEAGAGETRSRMILSLRRGELLIDSRSLTADSKFVVETPFGRISSVKAVLLISIEFDYRSGIYDFTISCVEGTVRLSDLRRQTYSIYAGQRIAGAGSYSAPAIEVGDQTDQIREEFELFLKLLDELEVDEIDRAKLWAQTRVLPDLQDGATTASRLSRERPKEARKEPRVIEFAPRAKAITPFRGEVKPPSENQSDLF